MREPLRQAFAQELEEIDRAGLSKRETVIASPQRTRVRVEGRELINLCANNYLGLADHPEIVEAVRGALDRWGFGTASVRFICGTQSLHKRLEERLTSFLGTEDTILYGSCFDANGGLFESLLGAEDVVLSDALNHASIIDGIRLCAARRIRYANNDIAELDRALSNVGDARRTLVATDGVFSMDGHSARLSELCAVADRHGSIVMVDDSHAVGFVGPQGRGTAALQGVADDVDIVTGTLGKALGGASGGYASGRRELVQLLRERSRPYLFSNTLAPPIAAGSLKALELLERDGDGLRARLRDNTAFFRTRLAELGLDVVPGGHAITPILVGDATRAVAMAEQAIAEGIFVVPFSYPVVPRGRARIRTQVCASHTTEELERAATVLAGAAAAVLP